MSDDHGAVRFGIDRLVVSGKRLFGWGWIADRERAIREIHLGVRGDGWQKRLAASFGIVREDVAEAFPDHAGARFAGFVVTGYVPAEIIGALSLEAAFEDGSTAVFDIGSTLEVNAAARAHRYTPARVARAVIRRLKAGDFRGLVRRDAREAELPSADEAAGREALLATLRGAKAVRVIFDHDMGGGANQYRRARIARWQDASEAAVLCVFNLPTLDYRFTVSVPGQGERRFRASSFMALEPLLEDARVAELFVNSPVSFADPIEFADWLARMKARHPATRLTLTLHDYFAVCPSFVLLNAEGRFCGVPDLRECERCLSRHTAAHVAFSPPTTIGPWREAWSRALEAADEVRCFSESSRALLLRAYPRLARESTTLVPHRVDFAPRAPRLRHEAPLAIGVVGQLSAQKGAQVVAELARLLERDPDGARIVVLGSLEISFRSPRLKVTGPYKREALPALLEEHGVNMVFFPSIWPETFSYVVAELTAMRVPVVAFDLGAPAERLRAYPLARLVPTVDAAAALETMRAFHRELAVDAAEAA